MSLHHQHNTQHAVFEKKQVALISVFAALVITGAKLIIGLKTNSLGILAEAAHSGLDLVAAIMTLVAVTISDKPADREHQYGHGKIENLSAFLETLLLVVTCGWIIYEAIHRILGTGERVDASYWGFGVIIGSIIIDAWRSRALYAAAKKHNSQALEADALHFASDIWSSLVVLIGLICVRFVPNAEWVDAVSALLVAVLVLVVCYRLGKRTIDALMDRLPESIDDKLTETVRSVKGVFAVNKIRVRPSGPNLFIDATIGISRTVPFLMVDKIVTEVESAVHEAFPNSDLIVHSEPVEVDGESIADKVKVATVGMGLLPPHNLEIIEHDGLIFIDFDLEYNEELSFTEAHEHSEAVETEIKRLIPNVGKVTIHLENYPGKTISILDDHSEQTGLDQQIRALVAADDAVLGIGELILLKVGLKYNLSLTCLMDKDANLTQIHQFTRNISSKLYLEFPLLRRVIVHAEPKVAD